MWKRKNMEGQNPLGLAEKTAFGGKFGKRKWRRVVLYGGLVGGSRGYGLILFKRKSDGI